MLEVLGPRPLRRFVQELIAIPADPQCGELAPFAQAINPDAAHITAAAVLAYGLRHALDAWGLWLTRAWASWLGAIAAALYLPLDLYALWHQPACLAIAVLAINLLVVWVLARDLLVRRY